MKLTCEGCKAVVEGETTDALHDAMMAHGDEAHANHFDGKSPEEVQELRKMMTAHVRKMIADQN